MNEFDKALELLKAYKNDEEVKLLINEINKKQNHHNELRNSID